MGAVHVELVIVWLVNIFAQEPQFKVHRQTIFGPLSTARLVTLSTWFSVNCVGEIQNPLHFRLSRHRSDIRNKKNEKPVAVHFNSPGHKLSDLITLVLEQMQSNNSNLHKHRESYWIHHFASKWNELWSLNLVLLYACIVISLVLHFYHLSCFFLLLSHILLFSVYMYTHVVLLPNQSLYSTWALWSF